ncbi:hypothetical protein MYX84_10195 [Acidobacteria bacterium AH-259-O06]|nr:hypothetical protein [Acidobacteria bacterium AH-259-O06]
MRIKTILTGAAALLFVQAAAYADISVSSPNKVATVISTDRATIVGDLRFTADAKGAVGDTIVLRYAGLPITNVSPSTNITITGIFGDNVPTFSVDATKGEITITTTGTADPAATFTLKDVRVSVDGSGLSSVKVTLTTVANLVIVGGVFGNEVEVVSALADGIAEVKTTTDKKTIVLATTGAKISGDPGEFTIKEGFKNAFKDPNQAGVGATQGTDIQLTATGIPTKVSITLTAPAGTSLSSTTLKPATTAAPKANVTTLSFTTTTTDLTKVETLKIGFTVVTTGATPPIAAGVISITATLVPIEDPLPTAGPTKAPKFSQKDLSTDIAAIISGTTNLFLPFLVWDSGFDTGIEIANTTADPFGTATGATAQSGTITFHFWANDGTAGFSYTTTTGSPGTGLTGAGVLASGSTYTVLVSELLNAAGRTTAFTGYGFAIVGSTHSHGAIFVSNFKDFTQGVPALVVPPTSIQSRKLQAFEQLAP